MNFNSFCYLRPGGQIHVGRNEFLGFDMPVMVEEIISYSALKCYKVSSDMEVGNAELFCSTMRLNINKDDPDYPNAIKMVLSSDTNAYGAIYSDTFVEGDVIKINNELSKESKTSKLVYMNQKNNIYLPLASNCSTENSLFQCGADICLDLILNGTCPTKCIPPISKSVLKLSTRESNLTLCDDYEANLCLGSAMLQKMLETNKRESCPKSCKQVDYTGQVIKTDSLERSWPSDMDMEVCFGFESMRIKIDEEYLIYSFADMIGAIGGSFGLFLGFSFLDQLFALLEILQQKLK